jgi:hypothetical protein
MHDAPIQEARFAVAAAAPHLSPRAAANQSPLRPPPYAGLDISGCGRLGDAALQVVGASLTALAALHARNCPRFTDRGLSQLTPLHASLLRLRLGPTPRVSDAGVAHVGYLTSLTSLELRGCPLVTGGGMTGLSRLRCLSILDVAGCGLGVEGILALSPLTGLAQVEF